MSVKETETLKAIDEGLCELSMSCFRIVRELCDHRINLISAVLGDMQEIVAANRRVQTLDIIHKGLKEERDKEKTRD